MMHAPYYYGPMSSGDWGFSLIMMLVWFLFIIAIIVFAAKMFRSNIEDRRRTSSPEPLETLKNRYAKGEITKEQYEQIKKDLR